MGKFDHVLLASDYDNTLVYTEAALKSGAASAPLCPRNREAIEYFTANGGSFSIATGRAAAVFARFAAQVPVNAPCVVANGAAVYDYAAEKYLFTRFLGDEIYDRMDEVFSLFPTVGVKVFHDDTSVHAVHVNEYIRNHQKLTGYPPQEVARFRDIPQPIMKVIFEQSHEELEVIRAALLQMPWIGEYELEFSASTLLELLAGGATKGSAVLSLAKLLGVPRENVYCIGDQENDLSMLRVSAIPFAPSNCVGAVREAGAHLVCHCADGAVADVIELLDKRY